MAGWVSLVAGFTGAIAFAATTFESYVLPQGLRPAWLPPDVLACSAIAAAGLAHGLRVQLGATVQNLVVILKLMLIGIFIWMAATNWNQNVWSGAATGRDLSERQDFWFSIATSIMWISLSYSGFNAAVYVAEESKSAARLVPRALLVGTLSVFVIYLALNFIFVYALFLRSSRESAQIAAIAARVVGGNYWEAWVRGIIVFAQLSSITSMIMAAPRVYAKMAQEGMLPARFRFEGEAREWRSWPKLCWRWRSY